MNFKNCLLPNEEQKIKLSEEGPLGPVFMVNLIKFVTTQRIESLFGKIRQLAIEQ
jgi:hypothetical protein